MVVVPFAHDQPDNAERVRRLGVARVVYPKKYTADRVTRELRDLLESGTCATRADLVGRTVRNERGVEAACDMILECGRGGGAGR